MWSPISHLIHFTCYNSLQSYKPSTTIFYSTQDDNIFIYHNRINKVVIQYNSIQNPMVIQNTTIALQSRQNDICFQQLCEYCTVLNLYVYSSFEKVSPDKALDKAIVRILSQQCVKEHCNHRNVPLQQSCGIVTWKSLARKNPRRMKHMMNRTKTIKVHVKVSAVSPKDKTDRTHC